jgi:peptidoglycan-associated lipoprotein
MIKQLKATLFGTLAATLLLAPLACKPKHPVVPKVTPSETMATRTPEPTAPTVDLTPPTTTVEPKEFVNEPKTTAEDIPADIEEANRKAQASGWLQDAFFGYDEAGLSNEAQAALQASATWLRAHPEYRLLVEGHCDERGTEQYNLALGDKRAQIVKDYLGTLGVDSVRIRTVSYGEERPFDQGHDDAAWAKNRRAHLVLAGK